MRFSITARRWIGGTLLTAAAISTLAPAALADHERSRRDRRDVGGRRWVERVDEAPRISRNEHSSAGPVIAGFLGGLIVGAVLASSNHAAPAPDCAYAAPAPDRGYSAPVPDPDNAVPAQEISYYDPYCDEDFATLDAYRAHLRDHRHPRVVQMIDVSSGECLHTYRWFGHGWRECDHENWEN